MSDSVLEWLLEKENPSVRFFALRDLLDCPADDGELQAVQRAIMRSAPVEKFSRRKPTKGIGHSPVGVMRPSIAARIGRF